MEGLPEGCVATILAHTTPKDACRLSLVSKIFRSAVESDAVWERFLPPNYHSQDFVPLHYTSKKYLYLAICPIIFDRGRKSFQLDKMSGKKCYMLAAKALSIVWNNTEKYWTWTSDSNSRFPKVAQLKGTCWLEIRGVINTRALSPNTQYVAYLVYKMIDAHGFRNCPVKLSVNFLGRNGSTKNVCLDPNREAPNYRVMGLQLPNERSDGWLEIEMGEFFNPGLEDEVYMKVLEIRDLNWKTGLILEGMEVMPKKEKELSNRNFSLM